MERILVGTVVPVVKGYGTASAGSFADEGIGLPKGLILPFFDFHRLFVLDERFVVTSNGRNKKVRLKSGGERGVCCTFSSTHSITVLRCSARLQIKWNTMWI